MPEFCCAARLLISPHTVQAYMTDVYTKLGLTSRVSDDGHRREDQRLGPGAVVLLLSEGGNATTFSL